MSNKEKHLQLLTDVIRRKHYSLARWHMHEANLQRAVKAAAAVVGIVGVTPHHLRHAYATHALEIGQSPRAIQLAMGHAYLDTTMGYLHSDALAVRSPLEMLAA